jgi:hypothetical protein
MEHYVAVYNSVEIGIWAAFGIGFLLAAIRRAGPVRSRCALAALAFFLFGASDAVELHTGAWWTPWWLFTWKALCVVALLVLYVENVLGRVRRAKQALGNVEARSDGQQPRGPRPCPPVKWRTVACSVLAFLVLVYVASYITMSRRGFRWADEYGFKGYYFYPYEDTDEWRGREYGTRWLFSPLIVLEHMLGTGRAPAGEPLHGLSADRTPNTAQPQSGVALVVRVAVVLGEQCCNREHHKVRR